MKVILEFDTVFWPHRELICSTPSEGMPANERGLGFMFWNMHVASGHPILVGLCSGESASLRNTLGEEGLMEKVVDKLRLLFPTVEVPHPVRWHVTNWAEDECTRGVYSYYQLGCNGTEYDVLAEPVGNVLYFAGEHTCKEHPDTMGGAMLSGIREAARILRGMLHPPKILA